MDVVVVLAVALPFVFALGCLLYPFRPKRWERLFYAGWQRPNSRKADAVILWPMGLAAAFVGGWIWYGTVDPLEQPIWPIGLAWWLLVVWGGGAVARAWGRRDRTEDAGRGNKAISRRRRVAAGMLGAISVGFIVLSHMLWSGSAGLARPGIALLHLATFPAAAVLAATAMFVVSRHRGLSRRLVAAAVAFFAVWGVAEVSYWPSAVYPYALSHWQDYRDPVTTPSVPLAVPESDPSTMETPLTFTVEDRKLGVDGASVEHVDFAGDDVVAIEEIWKSPDGPMTRSDRMFLGGEWRPKPDGYWRALGLPNGGALLTGKKKLLVDHEGSEQGTLPSVKAGFPVVALQDYIIYSVDEDDDGESGSEPGILSEGIFATDYNGDIAWRAASDSDPRFRGSVFSFYGATRTSRDTALVVVYGGFPPDDEALALYEVDPEAKSFERLPLPKEAFGTKAVVDLGDGWLCALGSYDDGDGRHHLRAWRRDGTGDVLVAKVPALKGWVSWRVQGGEGEFVTWEGGTVRQIVPKIGPSPA